MARFLIAIVLGVCLGGCAPKAGEQRLFLYYDMDGRASIVDVEVGRVVRVPALDRDEQK